MGEIENAERTGFAAVRLPGKAFLYGLTLYLTRQEITEMFPEKLFKLLQIAIVFERARDVPLAVPLPMRKELLQGIPLPNKGFGLLSRFQRRRRLRTVAINAQLRHTAVLACVVQRPANFVFRSRAGRAPIRHP